VLGLLVFGRSVSTRLARSHLLSTCIFSFLLILLGHFFELVFAEYFSCTLLLSSGAWLLAGICELLGVSAVCTLSLSFSTGDLLLVEFVRDDTHAFGFSVGDKVKAEFLAIAEDRLVDKEVPSSLELDARTFLERSERSLSNCGIFNARVMIDDVLDLVCVLEFALGDEMVKLDQGDLNSGVGVCTDPGDFLGVLEVFVLLIHSTKENELAILAYLFPCYCDIAPFHESNLLSYLDS